MKSQNDWIFSAVAVVLALIVFGIAIGTKREPVKPPAPTPVVTSAPEYPKGDVVYSNALPTPGNNPGGTGAPGGGGPGGGATPGGGGPAGGPGGRSRPSFGASGG